ncbi:alpha/beta fold hydrolase [Nocardia sp. NPDC059246]|uniref:alpha/beta fold hydrolase n=1 Tax=unclassified Nocardia TaxID=2637762 RepID=UPI0036761E82
MNSFDRCALTIRTNDDIRLAATRLGAPHAAVTVVYVHGLLCDSGYWAPVTEHLHNELDGELLQITYDQRGHGESGRPHRRTTTTLADLVDDLDAVLAKTAGETILVSHSAGSLVVAAYAQRYPQRAAALSGLVFFGATGEFPEFPSLPGRYRQMPQRLARFRQTRLDRLAATAITLAETRFRALSRRLGSKSHLVCGARRGDPRVLVDMLNAYNAFTVVGEEIAALRSVPAFVIAGGRDRVVPASQSVRFADKIWADYELIPDAGHALPHIQPTRAAETILHAIGVAYRRERDETAIFRQDVPPGSEQAW